MLGLINFTQADELLAVLGLSAIIKHLVFFQWRNKKPPNAEYVGKVSALTLYPLKSGRGVDVDQFMCDHTIGPHDGCLTDR